MTGDCRGKRSEIRGQESVGGLRSEQNSEVKKTSTEMSIQT